MSLYLVTATLKSIRHLIGSQCRYFRDWVTSLRSYFRVTIRAEAFRVCWSFVIFFSDTPTRTALAQSSREPTRELTAVFAESSVSRGSCTLCKCRRHAYRMLDDCQVLHRESRLGWTPDGRNRRHQPTATAEDFAHAAKSAKEHCIRHYRGSEPGR